MPNNHSLSPNPNQPAQDTIAMSDKTGKNIQGVHTVEVPAGSVEFTIYEDLAEGEYDVHIVCTYEDGNFYDDRMELKHPVGSGGTLLTIPAGR